MAVVHSPCQNADSKNSKEILVTPMAASCAGSSQDKINLKKVSTTQLSSCVLWEEALPTLPLLPTENVQHIYIYVN